MQCFFSHFQQGDVEHAQSCLEKAIDEAYPDRSKFKSISSASCGDAMLAERLNCASMLLQLGRYCDETASWESNAVVRQLKEVTQVGCLLHVVCGSSKFT
jgi:hypothetical protein